MEPVVPHCIHKCPPEPEQSSPCLPITLLEDPFQYHFPFYTKVFQVVSFPHVSLQTLYAPLPSPMRVTWPAHLIVLDLITRIIFGEQYTSLISSAPCSQKTLSLCSSLSVRDQGSYWYRTTGQIIVLYNLTFIFLNSNLEDKKFCTMW